MYLTKMVFMGVHVTWRSLHTHILIYSITCLFFFFTNSIMSTTKGIPKNMPADDFHNGGGDDVNNVVTDMVPENGEKDYMGYYGNVYSSGPGFTTSLREMAATCQMYIR